MICKHLIVVNCEILATDHERGATTVRWTLVGAAEAADAHVVCIGSVADVEVKAATKSWTITSVAVDCIVPSLSSERHLGWTKPRRIHQAKQERVPRCLVLINT